MPYNQFDAAIEFQLDLMRADAGIRYDILQVLKKLERELIGRVAEGNYTDWGKARIAKQLSEIRAVIQTYYDQMAGIAIDSTTAIAQTSATATAQALSVGAIAGLLPSDTVLAQIISNVLVQGAAQSAWWSRQSDNLAWQFSQVVRQGIAAAETNQQIISRVRGVMDVSRRGAAALVQTAVQTVANNARMATFEKNSDIVLALQWFATLDSHTCPRCAARDLLKWDTVTHEPIGHNLPFLNPPIHFNDRCILIPVTKFSDAGNPTRASADGQVSEKTSFNDFLERKGVAFQNEVLGEGRAQMWRDGKITLADLTNGNGNPLTLEQLQAKYQ